MALTRIDSYLVDLDSLGGITFDNQAGTPTFKVDAVSHRVGIGTTNPASRLDVVAGTGPGAVNFRVAAPDNHIFRLSRIAPAAGPGNVDLQVTTYGAGSLIADDALNLQSGTSTPIRFYTSGFNERVRIDSSGNVGIGTTNPAKSLHATGEVQFSTNTKTHVTHLFTTGNADDGVYLIKNASNIDRVLLHSNGSSYFNGGNVGIGITNPSTKFQINLQDGFRFDVGANAYSYMRFGSAASGEGTAEIGFERTTGNIYLNRGSTGSALTTALTVDVNSRIGIGTTLPGTRLDIVNGISRVRTGGKTGSNIYLKLESTDASNTMELQFGNFTNLAWQIQAVENGVSYRSLVLNPVGGSVGIGTTNPGAQLDIVGNSRILGTASLVPTLTIQAGSGVTDGYSRATLNFWDQTGTGGYTVQGLPDGGIFQVSTRATSTNTPRITLTSGGNVGIGTTNPGALLHTYGKTRFGNNFIYYGEIDHDASVTGANIYNSVDTGGHIFQRNGNELFRISANGNVGIGTTNPQAKLDVLGSAIISRPGTTSVGDTIYALKVGMGAEASNVSGRQFGLRVEQGGARYTDQTAVYATHTDTIGNFAGNYRGVHGVTYFGTQAGGSTEAIFGETTVPSWNYQARHCGVRGIAAGGSTAFNATYGLGVNNGAFGGHFVAYGKADVVGVYADAYHLASPGAGTQVVPLMVASNGTELMRVNGSGNVGIGTINPLEKLHIESSLTVKNTGSSNTITIYPDNSNGPTIVGHTDSSGISTGAYTGSRFRPANGGFFFDTSPVTTVGVSRSWTTRVVITDIGNVGIGTTNPTQKLHVVGNSYTTGYVQGANALIGDTAGSSYAVFGSNSISRPILITRDADPTGRDLFINASGNIGIGTTGPVAQFHIGGTASNNNPWGVFDISDGYFKKIIFSEERGAYGLEGYGGYVGYNASDNNLVLGVYENSVDNRAINIKRDNGNVGIGTTNPVEELHIFRTGTDNFVRIDAGGTSGGKSGIKLLENNILFGWEITHDSLTDRLEILHNAASAVYSPSSRMSFTPTGNVGIGTTNPNYKFEISESEYSRLTLLQSTTGRRWQIGNDGSNLYIYNELNAVRALDITSTGRVLIGTQTINGALLNIPASTVYAILIRNQNAGTFNASIRFSNTTNGTVGSILTDDSSTTYNTISDYRLKENIVPISDAIARLKQLKPSRFNFIVNPNKIVDGFIAHEVQDIVPESVSGNKDDVDSDGNPIHQGIDQSKLIPLLTAALQEAILRIEQLESRL